MTAQDNRVPPLTIDVVSQPAVAETTVPPVRPVDATSAVVPPDVRSLLETFRDALTTLLAHADRQTAYHLFVVPDAADPRLETFDSLEALVAKIREYSQQDLVACPFVGAPLLVTSQSHCLVTEQGTFPLAAAEQADTPRPWFSFGGSLEDALSPATADEAEDHAADPAADADGDELLGG